jgi:hypothetical protein
MCACKLQEVTCDHVSSYGLERRKEGSIIHQKLKGQNVSCLVVQLFHDFEIPPIKIANVSKRSAKRDQVNSQGDAKFPSFLCVQVNVGFRTDLFTNDEVDGWVMAASKLEDSATGMICVHSA